MDAYSREIKEVLEFHNSSEEGLSSQEAETRLGKFGPNELKTEHSISRISIFVEQFKSFIVLILVLATLISAFLGEWVDAIAIFIILILNAVLGFIQEYNAEKAIEALKKMSAPKATVLRDGKTIKIESKDLVPGDIILLTTGDKVPADARIFESESLQAQEAVLTGESVPVKKQTGKLAMKLEIGDRKNMVFSGTIITKGKGKAVVTGTGMFTEMGKIAGMISQEQDVQTPLQEKLDVLGEKIGVLTIVVSAIVFGAGIFGGQELLDMFLVSVSLAVAAIPEGLPAVITISLAFGVQRMLKKNALVRKLPSVETLGSTTVICSDKTGTLTHNEMTVKKVFVDNRFVEVTGTGYNPKGEVNGRAEPILFRIGALCNDAELVEDTWTVIGDPTEGCLLTSARKAGLSERKLRAEYPRVAGVPFDSTRKRMTTIHEDGKKKVAYTKGAPDVIVNLCNRKLVNGKVSKLTEEERENILKANHDFSKDALRVLAFAYKDNIKEAQEYGEDIEKDLIFVGLQAMIDPPRMEVKDAIAKCNTAGIKVVMVTGDHKDTAVAIANDLGIYGEAVEGKDIDSINLAERASEIAIYARVSPEHKLRIVEALKNQGHIVAMTGDGVNDAPALKKADIGIAMGITGTDVAKEASEMILTDDNFASIVNAVEEGRGIYDNIKKFVNYLLSSNFGEVLALFLAMLIGFRGPGGEILVPFLALQILWINLVTDSLPALALGVDPSEKDIMTREPRDPKKGIISLNMTLNIIVIGILIAISTLFLFKITLPDVERARTVAVTTLVIMEIVRLQMIRQTYNMDIGANKYLIWAVVGVLALQFIAIYSPLNQIVEFVPLMLMDWVYIITTGAFMLVVGTIASHFIKELTQERD